MTRLVDRLAEAGVAVQYLDMGGGLGIVYDEETPTQAQEYAHALVRAVGTRDLTLIIEPGRSIVGNAGVLLTRVLFHKGNNEKNFIVVDAAMNDLMRPMLYQAYHAILPVTDTERTVKADVVGPICETGDFLARDREVACVEPGGIFAVMSAGAYGFVMLSNYHTRGRAAEVQVDGTRFDVVRRRETVDDLLALESVPETLR